MQFGLGFTPPRMDLSKIIATFILVLVIVEADEIKPDHAEIGQDQKLNPVQIVYEWDKFNFTWPSPQAYRDAVNDLLYYTGYLFISSIGVYKDYIYISLSKHIKSVPATLVRVPVTPVDSDTSPRLDPFPSWAFNTEEKDCMGLNSVSNFVIDPSGHIWLIDNGHSSDVDLGRVCPISLKIIDIEFGMLTYHHVFPEGVVHNDSFLNDIAIDSENGFVYVVDESPLNQGIIVFDKRENKSWKIEYTATSPGRPPMDNVRGVSLGLKFINDDGNVDRMIYYWSQKSSYLKSVPVSLLKEGVPGLWLSDIGDRFKLHNRKLYNIRSMITDENGVLYYGKAMDGIGIWNTNTSCSINQRLFPLDENTYEIQDKLAFDTSTNLYVGVVFKDLRKQFENSKFKYKIVKIDVGARSYQYSPSLAYTVKD